MQFNCFLAEPMKKSIPKNFWNFFLRFHRTIIELTPSNLQKTFLLQYWIPALSENKNQKTLMQVWTVPTYSLSTFGSCIYYSDCARIGTDSIRNILHFLGSETNFGNENVYLLVWIPSCRAKVKRRNRRSPLIYKMLPRIGGVDGLSLCAPTTQSHQPFKIEMRMTSGSPTHNYSGSVTQLFCQVWWLLSLKLPSLRTCWTEKFPNKWLPRCWVSILVVNLSQSYIVLKPSFLPSHRK